MDSIFGTLTTILVPILLALAVVLVIYLFRTIAGVNRAVTNIDARVEQLGGHLSEINANLNVSIKRIADSVVATKESINTTLNNADNVLVELPGAVTEIKEKLTSVENNTEEALLRLNATVTTINETIPPLRDEVISFLQNAGQVVLPVKAIVNTVSNPIRSVSRFSSAANKFIEAFRDKLKK